MNKSKLSVRPAGPMKLRPLGKKPTPPHQGADALEELEDITLDMESSFGDFLGLFTTPRTQNKEGDDLPCTLDLADQGEENLLDEFLSSFVEKPACKFRLPFDDTEFIEDTEDYQPPFTQHNSLQFWTERQK